MGNASLSAGTGDGARIGAEDVWLDPVVMVWVPRVGVMGLDATGAAERVTGGGNCSTGDGMYSPRIVEGVTGSSHAGPRSCVADTGVTMSSGTLASLTACDVSTAVEVVFVV